MFAMFVYLDRLFFQGSFDTMDVREKGPGMQKLDELILLDCALSSGLSDLPVPPQLLVPGGSLVFDLVCHAEAQLSQGRDVVPQDEGVRVLEEQLDGVGQVGGLAKE